MRTTWALWVRGLDGEPGEEWKWIRSSGDATTLQMDAAARFSHRDVVICKANERPADVWARKPKEAADAAE